MHTGNTRITGLCHTAVYVALGAALVMLLGADTSMNATVPPGLDSTAQRLRAQEELVSLNSKMDELIALLKSGNVKVVCIRADNDGRGLEHGTGARDTIALPECSTAPSSGNAR